MRFPSLDQLARHAAVVLRRFPWTLAVGAVAALAGIMNSFASTGDTWERLIFVALLGLPLTLALTLVGEERNWPSGVRHLAILVGLAALGVFYAAWPGMDQRHDVIRYLQLSAVLHLCVAFLPYVGAPEGTGFWQYNRRLFLGFLRAVVFSMVLFVGIAIALGALDKLFGVDVDGDVYLRIWFVVAFLVNTWIFLAVVPERLETLEQDSDYPRALKVFAQYILTPLAFTYLVILLAYLIKIVAGGEWPSGWIGWLVGSVSVTGLLGFLLVHPLRTAPGEGWIRTYARWLFIGLIPAALMLLVAFWKRIVPYGLTEPRVLGIVLGIWLLGIALLFTVRSGASIRTIPVSLALVLLVTLYGPLGLSQVSINSQARRLERMLRPEGSGAPDVKEASAALRFLMDHDAGDAIARAIGREVPEVNWSALPRWSPQRDSVARTILALADVEYVPEHALRAGGWFHISTNAPIAVSGYAWAVEIRPGDNPTRVVGGDTITARYPTPGDGIARIRVGSDTLAFNLLPIADRYADSGASHPAALDRPLLVEGPAGTRRSTLAVTELNGQREGDSVRIVHWGGTLLLGE